MQLEARKYLYDIQQAAGLLDEFVTYWQDFCRFRRR